MKTLLVLLTASKFGKAFLMAGTMLLSMVMYSLVFGWWYAIGFVLLIFGHETGHYLAAKQRGLQVGVPMFIPFIGAWIQLKEQPMNVETEAYVAMAGPVAGTLAAVGCYYASDYFSSKLLLALAYSGFMLNLFNLIPLSPLDGGRITAIISPRVWLLGIPILLGLFIIQPSPMLLIIALVAAPQAWVAFTGRYAEGLSHGYYETPLSTKVSYASYYLGLAVFLSLMSYQLHQVLPGPH